MASRSPLFIEVKDDAGFVVAGAAVTILNRATALAATVYLGETGTGTASNPMTTDANGRVSGWVDRGDYLAQVEATGIVPYTIPIDAAPAGDRNIDLAWAPKSISPTYVVTTGGTGTTPSGPGDGDRFVWAPTTPTVVSPVEFRYRSGSSSIYKWEAMGGAGLTESGSVCSIVPVGGTWYNLNIIAPAMTSSFTIPFTGEYDITLSISGQSAVAAVHQYVGISLNNANPTKLTVGTSALAGYYQHTAGRWITTFTAGDVLRIYGQVNASGTWTIQSRSWHIKPIRVL